MRRRQHWSVKCLSVGVLRLFLSAICLLLLGAPASFGQQAASPNPVLPPQPGPPPQPEHKRILGIIPNYRTAPTLKDYRPLTPEQKFKITAKDSFDPGTFALAALFAGTNYLNNSNPSFGHGGAAISRYFGAAYGDAVIGNFMTGAIYPVILHQDPRYFRRGTGTGLSRMRHAMGQIFWTRSDSNHGQFNYSEVLGNSTAAGIATAYYPDNRGAGAFASRLGIQLGIDMAGNVLKEFWPDLDQKLSRKHHAQKP
jgi:hypothetical protein